MKEELLKVDSRAASAHSTSAMEGACDFPVSLAIVLGADLGMPTNRVEWMHTSAGVCAMNIDRTVVAEPQVRDFVSVLAELLGLILGRVHIVLG